MATCDDALAKNAVFVQGLVEASDLSPSEAVGFEAMQCQVHAEDESPLGNGFMFDRSVVTKC